MTLREILNGIFIFINNLFKKILDFDLTNIFLVLFLIFFIFYIIWMVRKSTNYLSKNYRNSSIIKKIGLIFGYVLILFVLIVAPFLIILDVFFIN